MSAADMAHAVKTHAFKATISVECWKENLFNWLLSVKIGASKMDSTWHIYSRHDQYLGGRGGGNDTP